MKKSCSICNSADIEFLLSTEVPTLQNRVYETLKEALHCSKGVINLAHCNYCNFTFNANFDENVIVYDEKYDNAVPSKLFINYYNTICRYLYEKYNLESGVIYDIGCGKGTFLKIMCALYPNLKGIGIDPSYEGELKPMENLTFIRDFFKAEHVTETPSLLLSRHVFEHIEFPRKFLEIIREPVKAYKNLPVFIEVPDFSWIVEHKTFWDICYEHCNYFSQKSIEEMFGNSWSTLNKITKSFGDQYLWIEGIFNEEMMKPQQARIPSINKAQICDFIDSISLSRKNVCDRISSYKDKGYKIIIWGMATKGVIFTNSIDKQRGLVDYCIDINTEKQNKYSPLSGHFIQEPGILATLPDTDFLVIVMNTNYSDEIKSETATLNLRTHFIDAHGIDL